MNFTDTKQKSFDAVLFCEERYEICHNLINCVWSHKSRIYMSEQIYEIFLLLRFYIFVWLSGIFYAEMNSLLINED